MYHLHLTRNLRSLAFILGLVALISALGVIGWANHTGLPMSWRAAIEREVSKQGAHIKIGGLSYLPFKGVVATDLQVFSDAGRLREVSKLESVILDFDNTKLARGEIKLNKIELKDARLVLPVDPTDPDSEALHITDAHGTLLMPGNRRLEIRKAHGKIAGIDLKLDAKVIGYQQDDTNGADKSKEGKRRELIAKVIHELNQWKFAEDHAPSIQISLEGDVNDSSTLTAKVVLDVQEMERNGHVLEKISGQADLKGDLLTVNSLRATDDRGAFEGRLDYDLGSREGRFDVTSSLEVPQLLKAWLGLPALPGVVIGGKQSLEVEGDFQLDERNAPHIRMTGRARCESVMLRGMSFDLVEGDFSWRDGDLFMRDLRLARQDGMARGKALVEWPLVRLELHSTLPVPVYRPFFVGQPLEIVLNNFTERKGAKVDVMLEGGFDLTNRYAWAYTGKGAIENLNYKGVPVNAANCQFSLNHHELDFHDGTLNFNYDDYGLRKAFDGSREGTAKVGRIRYEAASKTVEVESVTGAIWAAPMVRLFAPAIADTLEQYRFHQPPELSGSGIVDVTPQGRTALDVSFRSSDHADYRFLGENLTLFQPSGKVAIRGPRVTVTDLKANTFDGPIAAKFENGGGKLQGEMSWTKLSIPGLASTYGFQIKGGGSVTGRIDFSITDGKVETMTGKGLLALEQAELFTVPMFGPLTPLIGGVLNDETAGTQRASNAFCTFDINQGILSTNDFQTSTKSLNFTGDGSVDLIARTVDMTLRMNAQGVLRYITMPLRPFSGLFQFRGTGALKHPTWESMKFTPPLDVQNELLLDPPKARMIIE